MLGRLLGLIIIKLISPLSSFLIIVLVGRMWGKAELGAYYTVLTWLAIFQFVSLFGMGEYILREVGKDHSSGTKYLTHGLFFALMSSLVCIVVMLIGVLLFRYPEEVRNGIFVASIALPFIAFSLICQAGFIVFQKIKYIAIISLLENVAFLLICSVVIYARFGIVVLIWCLVVIRVLASLLNLCITHKRIVGLRFQIDWSFFWKLLAPVAVFGLTGIASQIFMRIDIIILSRMKTMADVGLFGSASRLWEVCLLLPFAFYVLNLPVMAQCYTRSPESVHQKTEAYTSTLFILGFLAFGFMTFFAESILNLVYGKSFIDAAWIMRILMLAFLVQNGEMVLGMTCQAAGYHKAAMHIAILRALANIILNILLIPVWGLIGAALATLLSIMLSFIVLQLFVNRTLNGFRWIRISIKPGLACLITIFLLLPLVDWFNTYVLWFLFLLGYGLMIFALYAILPLKAKTISLQQSNPLE